MKWWDQMPWSLFYECWVLTTFWLSSFTFIMRLFSSSSLSAIRVVSSAYRGYWCLSQQSWFQLVLHPSWHFASCTYTWYKLNEHGDNIQPWHTPYPIWNICFSMSGYNYGVLINIQMSQEAGNVVWYSHVFKNFPQFAVIHTVKVFGKGNKAEVHVFLELLIFWWSNGCWQFDPWFLCCF